MDKSVLVLNNTYEAIHICSLRRAVILVLKGVAVVEETTETLMHSLNMSFAVPSVIRLIRYIIIPQKNVHLNRKNIILRDKHTCQYCGKEYKSEDLTVDHVVPRAIGGPTAWDNVVACCKRCNNRKADRPPRESGMKLIKKPEMPKRIVYLHIVRYMGRDIDQWKKYIYY